MTVDSAAQEAMTVDSSARLLDSTILSQHLSLLIIRMLLIIRRKQRIEQQLLTRSQGPEVNAARHSFVAGKKTLTLSAIIENPREQPSSLRSLNTVHQAPNIFK